MSGASRPIVVLVRGDDASLVADALGRVVDEAVGDADRTLVVDEYAGEEYELAAAADAAQTPPFLTDHRVVVARDMQRFTNKDAVVPVVDYLADPLPTSTLVLVWEGGGRLPKSLTDAVKNAGGETISASVPSGRARSQWVEDRINLSGVVLDTRAKTLVTDQLGDDLDRLAGVLGSLASIYGTGNRLSADDVAPFLGEAGSVPPWELTDAIDKGDIPVALDKLSRMLGAGSRHPLQVMVTLHQHYERMLRLDGSDARGEKQAAARLGMKGSTFPARKALEQGRRLGGRKIGRAIELLADADLDLRGASAWPSELVMEVLVARLTRLSR
ncbi:MAG: DNA polymerase III subunit delta [Actinomycetota bacterium]|nr:DNA polymerase III subunit delta [Actinomycetota bacterium]